MVTIKKTLTLFLVIVMLSGVVALPAFATTLDSVVPCGQITSCEKCGATVPIDVYSTKEDVYVKCDRYPNTIHKHILTSQEIFDWISVHSLKFLKNRQAF